TNYPVILVVSTPKEENQIISAVDITDKAVIKANELEEILLLIRKQKQEIKGIDFLEINQNNLSTDKWQIVSKEKESILKKIKENGKPLYPEFADDVIIGMRTGYNEAFFVDSPENFEEGLVKKVVTGKDVEPFAIKNPKYCLYPNGKDARLIPRTIKHLTKFKNTLENRAQFKQRKDMQWFEIEQPVSPEKFGKPKILTPAISEKSSFYFDDNGLFCFDSCNMIFLKSKKKEEAYYIVGLLNSNLIFFYLTSYSPYVQAKYFTYKPQYLKPMPIVAFNEKNPACVKIVGLSKQLHAIYKKSNKQEQKELEKTTKDIHKQIDSLVFDLYGLSIEERKIIEFAVESDSKKKD
ncbi:MAG: TaqI-like C-terminal specificity domain-containing protein, partial [Candidatus ainarchaeum sp.]|nr:TaqI-like C-terminal specificity domain-containing protein [Candidatus ainarchaeum sp.]